MNHQVAFKQTPSTLVAMVKMSRKWHGPISERGFSPTRGTQNVSASNSDVLQLAVAGQGGKPAVASDFRNQLCLSGSDVPSTFVRN